MEKSSPIFKAKKPDAKNTLAANQIGILVILCYRDVIHNIRLRAKFAAGTAGVCGSALCGDAIRNRKDSL
ncbi:hypothetical protein IDJ77_08775 [Mucilaginibacter sp. ZT4R22]|uniref:Uncharacterized protein n=1 Tax=Mucilaginibacter pankratovii TaxID=2772110 RepID=A0ABR7WNK5_9SPHI|nr:hypothetical protein [Mucilaginibacter pankratovii]MBD1363899.1 hypothetical protein [Mucilaginibacter pankratovii]